MPEIQLDQAGVSAPPRSGQKFRVRGWVAGLRLTILTFVIFAASPARAQSVIDLDEDLHFNRPEAWALKYFSAATLPTGLGARGPRADEEAASWRLDLALEGGWLPELSAQDRRVGFYGEKVEDLNKTSVFGRLRVGLALPAKLRLELGYVPPIEVGGAKPSLLSLALSRSLFERAGFELSARAFALRGTIEADITCDQDTVDAGDDPIRNPFRCEAPSEDEVTLRSMGLELALDWRPTPRFEPYLAVSFAALDPEFQINARYSGLIDRTHQETDGDLITFQLGLSSQWSERRRLAVEVFFAPLKLEPRLGADLERRDLWNLRLLFTQNLTTFGR